MSAVPDPTVEALSVAEREAIRVCPDCGHGEDFHSNVGCVKGYDRSPVEPCGCERQWSEVIPAAVAAILAARAAAPDALRVRLYVALVEQRVIDSRHYGEAPYAPIAWADVDRALLEG